MPSASRSLRAAWITAGIVALIATAMVVLPTPGLAGTTYRWVDKDGQVHLSDTPPVGVPYETIMTPTHATPPSSPEPAPAATAPLPPRLTEATPSAPPRAAATAAQDAEADAACVDALYQLDLLAMQARVFKPLPGGERMYLDDRDRPAEVERLTRVRDANCSADKEVLATQQSRSRDLKRELSPGCTEAREKLANLKQPGSHAVKSQVERQQEYVDNYCRDPAREDVWLGDWILVRRR